MSESLSILEPVLSQLTTPRGQVKLARQEAQYLFALAQYPNGAKAVVLANGLERERGRKPGKNHIDVVASRLRPLKEQKHQREIPIEERERRRIIGNLVTSKVGIHRFVNYQEFMIDLSQYNLTAGENYYHPQEVDLKPDDTILDLVADVINTPRKDYTFAPVLKRMLYILATHQGIQFSSQQLSAAAERILGKYHAPQSIHGQLKELAETMPLLEVIKRPQTTTFAINETVIPVIHIAGRRHLFEQKG